MNKTQIIRCKYPDGSVRDFSYKEIKDHNYNIIQGNVAFGLLHPGDYTEREVNEYYESAIKKHKARMKAIRETPNIVLVWNRTHQMFELEEEQND